MEGESIIQFLSVYGYWVMLPLMTIEGPIVTLIATFMATNHVAFSVPVVYLFSVIGDILGDVVLYALGFFGGTPFAQKYGKYIGVSPSLIARIKNFFVQHGGKTIFLVKTTTGLCWVTFFTAGMIKMPFKKFLFYSLWGGVLWSGFIVACGYFFGYLYAQIAQSIEYAGWVIFGVAVVFVIGFNLFKKYETQKIFPTKKH